MVMAMIKKGQVNTNAKDDRSSSELLSALTDQSLMQIPFLLSTENICDGTAEIDFPAMYGSC